MGRPGKPLNPEESLTAYYGWRVRQLREERGWSQTELGKRIAMSTDAVSKLELGLSAPDDRTGELLDTVYGTAPYFRDHAPLVRKERIPQSVRSLGGSEGAASKIEIYEPNFVTGLFQIEDYTRALFASGTTAEEMDEVVANRLHRQEVLNRRHPPRIRVVTDEGALRRAIGGPGVLKAQLVRLEELAERQNVSIQAVPATTPAYGGLVAAFSLLTPPKGDVVAYVEGPAGTGQFIDQPERVARLLEKYDEIRDAASSTIESARLIREIRESL